MLNVAAPTILGYAAFAAALTVVLHFLSVRRPPVLLLPTMRFLPVRPVRAVSRSARPSDLLLMLLRVLAILCIGVALAGVGWRPSTRVSGRVVVVDRTRALRDANALRQRLGVELRDEASTTDGSHAALSNSRVVVLDSVAHIEPAQGFVSRLTDSTLLPSGDAPLSAAVLSSVRAASEVARASRAVDSIELVILSSFTRDDRDDALAAARAMWPGRIRLIDVGVMDTSAVNEKWPRRQFESTNVDEAVATALAAHGFVAAANVSDSRTTGASSTDSPVVIDWPANGVPRGWSESPSEQQGAIATRGRAVVAPFVRSAKYVGPARTIAWWTDGAPAAVETRDGAGCVRTVAVQVAHGSDVLLSASMRSLFDALSAPCGGSVDARPMPEAQRTMLAGTGALASSQAFLSRGDVRTPYSAWWLMFALALLITEHWLRERGNVVAELKDRSLTRESAHAA